MSNAHSDELLSWGVLGRFVLRLARPEAKLLTLLAVLSVLLSLLEGGGLTLGLFAVYRLLDGQAGQGWIEDEPGLGFVAGMDTMAIVAIAIGMVLLSAILSSTVRVLSEVIANRVTHYARNRVYQNYLLSTYEHASRRGHGAMLDTLDYETPFLTEAVLHMVAILGGGCAVLVYGSYLLVLSPPLGLAALVLGLVLSAILSLAARRLSVLGGRVSQLNERLLAQTMATVAGLRTVRLHAAEQNFIARYAGASEAVAHAHVDVAKAQGLVAALRQIGKLAALVTLVWVAIGLKVPGPVIIMVFALLLRLLPHVTDAEDRVVALFNSRLPLSIVYRAMRRSELPMPVSGERTFAPTVGDIELRNIGFAHEEDVPVLRDVSLTIPAGALVTLIGPSGGGKTTLINLLARLYEPHQGQILVDGAPLSGFSRASWLSRLGFSGQDLDLQEGTILENIRFFDTSISEADVRWAMEVSHIADFVDSLPDRVHTSVGDRGLRLSGGQRQRIGLARAIVRRPELLILDEATNAVDVALEAQIIAAVRAALPRSTILIVTHRAAVAGADDAFMLDGGGVTKLDGVAAK